VHQILFVTQLGTILSPEIWGKWGWFFGVWEMHESHAELVPVTGLCYWLTPPTWRTLSADRPRTFVYITYVPLTFALFSRWAVSGEDCDENPENVIADLLGPTQITLATNGNRDENLRTEVWWLVPSASIFGGLTLGCVCITIDVFGVIGGGQEMLIATSVIYKGYELWLKEHVAFSGRRISAELIWHSLRRTILPWKATEHGLGKFDFLLDSRTILLSL
jgi:preprotein translocase subunit SecY